MPSQKSKKPPSVSKQTNLQGWRSKPGIMAVFLERLQANFVEVVKPDPRNLTEHIPRIFNCFSVHWMFLKINVPADAKVSLSLTKAIHFCTNTSFFLSPLLTWGCCLFIFAICPGASLKIHEWTNWPDILWGTGAIVCPWRLALKIWLWILKKEHLQQSVREQLGKDLAVC